MIYTCDLSLFYRHQARFNYPIPKIPEPTILQDTAQSLAAQQYYLSLVYQSVNQYADPQRQQQQQQVSPIGRPSQVNYSQPPPPLPQQQQQLQLQQQQQQQQLLLQQQQQQQQMMHQQRVPLVEPIICGALLQGNQICRRPVNRQGEKCQLHMPVKQMSDYAKAPPPVSHTTMSFSKFKYLLRKTGNRSMCILITSVQIVINYVQPNLCLALKKNISQMISQWLNVPSVQESITLFVLI